MSDLPLPGQRFDRIDNRGDIREHVMAAGEKTLCGLAILNDWQEALDGFMRNAQCGRCKALLARRAQ